MRASALAEAGARLAGGAGVSTQGLMDKGMPITSTIDNLLGCPSIA
jgi:hypothetical protein